MGCPLRNPSLFTLRFDSLPQFYFLKQLKTIKNNQNNKKKKLKGKDLQGFNILIFVHLLFPEALHVEGVVE